MEKLHNTQLRELFPSQNTVLSESRCALRLQYVDFIVRIKIAVAVCCCFTVFSC
jgi:hypothetical protein